MFQIPLATSASIVSKDEFWKSVSIYHNRPHIVNRKIAVADQILFYEVDLNADNTLDITDVLSPHALSYEVQKLEKVDRKNISQNLLMNLLVTYDKNVKFSYRNIDAINILHSGVYLSVRIIIPRMQKCSRSIELVVLDKNKDHLTFFSACFDEDKLNPLPPFPYRIELSRENIMRIVLNSFEDADTSCAEWLLDSLFKKLMNWTTVSEGNIIQSLTRVSLEKYCYLYNHLKEKYGESLRKIWWEKTKTDPQKFIFEDIAIVSYLICMWDEAYGNEAKTFVKFVDCGCGNGLLVYILNKEGFEGYGIDLRKRKIWDLFLDSSVLQVGAVDPNSKFPEATWLIGNHSDELTPWLPAIASRSSPRTNYFVLPCCPFDFNGKKYIRKNTKLSQYADYLEYIKEISEICEFDTTIDKLRIPSTKRTCLVGLREKNGHQNILGVCEKINEFVRSRFSLGNSEFKARPSVEIVRNCTQIDRSIRERIVKEVVDGLLKNKSCIIRDDGSMWNGGGSIPLRELPKLLKRDDLNLLKKECGGLQTLLRNHRYIFRIDKADVSLRTPYKMEETNQYKEKPCWFYHFHPNGCLYKEGICGYSHDKKNM